jgi:molybdopterin molybdotransferase
VVVEKPSAGGRHIRREGLDFRAGDVLLPRGKRLTARDLALAAAMNYPDVPVHRGARVALLATGDELVMPGTTPGHGQIVYSNGYALMAQVAAEGAEVIDLGIAPTGRRHHRGGRRAQKRSASTCWSPPARLGRRGVLKARGRERKLSFWKEWRCGPTGPLIWASRFQAEWAPVGRRARRPAMEVLGSRAIRSRFVCGVCS